ncbi:MAG: nuclear transport factor 2 family protein [Bryobacteraceae bacterium]
MRLLVAFLVLAGLAFGQDADIRAAEKTWSKAILAKDTSTLEKLLADDLIYAHSTGIVDTKSTYLAKIAGGGLKYEAVDFESMTVKPYGDTAVMFAHMRIRGINQNGPFNDRLLMMHVWRKSGKDWQLVAHQTTKVP